jgi:hypothetical protein
MRIKYTSNYGLCPKKSISSTNSGNEAILNNKFWAFPICKKVANYCQKSQ